MLPGQMSLLQSESVLDVPRSLHLKFQGAFKYYISTFWGVWGRGYDQKCSYCVYNISISGGVKKLGKPAYIILAHSLREDFIRKKRQQWSFTKLFPFFHAERYHCNSFSDSFNTYSSVLCQNYMVGASKQYESRFLPVQPFEYSKLVRRFQNQSILKYNIRTQWAAPPRNVRQK